MKYTIFAVGIIVVLGIVSLIAYRFLRPRSGGFQDWVKNPGYKQAVDDYFAARESLEVPHDISNEEIQRMIDRLYIQKDEDFNFDRLKRVGIKAVPMLIKALKEPKTASTDRQESVR